MPTPHHKKKAIRFLSSNEYKIKEVCEILNSDEIEVRATNYKVEELQTEDAHRLVEDKTLKAFKEIGQPLFVEHTGLYVDSLNGLPAGLTQIFWDRLQADQFASLIGGNDKPSLIAKTIIGYCDGRKMHYFEGEIKGTVPLKPAGNRDFQWDCVFIPDGHTQTFAEMEKKKNEISMRKIALENFKRFLEKT